MNKKKSSIDVEYLKRCRAASPESKLEWLASAVEFARAPKKIIRASLK